MSEVLITGEEESKSADNDESEEESEDGLGDENKDEDDNEDDYEDDSEDEGVDEDDYEDDSEDEGVDEDDEPTQADLDMTKKHNKDLERYFGNNQYIKFMEEFNRDRSIIESGRALTDGDIELVKESTNYQDEHRVAFTLLKDVFPVWLAKHERFLGVTFYKKKDRQCKGGGRVEYFRCSCSGNKEVKKNRHAGGRTGMKHIIRKESKKIGCKSRINFHHKSAQSLPSLRVVEVVEVQYFYRHNHNFEKTQVAHLPLSNGMKRLIRAEVENGVRNRDIKVKLSKSNEQIAADVAQGLRPTRDDILTADDIQNVKHKVNMVDVKKHDNRVISAQLWMEEISREQGFSYHDGNDDTYCFSSKWQMEKLLAHGDVICIDGTHEAFGMHYQQDYSPNVVLMDQGHAEFDTIAAAFPSAKVFYCYFHILKSITGIIMKAKDARVKCLDEAGRPMKRLMTANAPIQALAVKDFNTLVTEEDLTKANRKIDDYRDKWKKYAFLGKLKRYLEDEMRPRWMFAYRKDISYGRMETNNLIESYHNQVKRHYLGTSRRRYTDKIIYVLYRQVLPSYELKSVTSDSGAGRMFAGSRRTLELRNMAKEYAAKNITDNKYGRIKYDGDSTVKIRSLSTKTADGKNVYYRMSIDFEHGTISRCSCPTGFQFGIECHHVALVRMELKHLEFDSQQRRVEWNPGFVPPETAGRRPAREITLEDINGMKEELQKAVSVTMSLKPKDYHLTYSRLQATILKIKHDQKIELEGCGKKANRVERFRGKRQRYNK
ncbi:hypothetical protein BGX24_007160 [Mortierella sp. AD032]|nr:hypothetical protein BGX24_007160 [Mortierella sp. AD032]